MAEKVRTVLNRGQEKLAEAGISDARFDSRALLSFVLGIPFSKMPFHLDDEVDKKNEEEFAGLLEKRMSGIPLQYITGEQEFMGLTFHVDERVLIPRLDTEVLTEEAIKCVNEHKGEVRVLDLCCGSGAIGLSIAALAGCGEAKPQKRSEKASGLSVTLIDISKDALDVAKENAKALGLANQVNFLQGDLFKALDNKKEDADEFDLIVSNPPYIPSDVIGTLDTEVKDHEPMLALDGGEDGLDIYRRIITGASKHLKSGGVLMMEIGFDQAEAIKKLAYEAGSGSDEKRRDGPVYMVQFRKDLAGLDRVAILKVQ